MPGWTQQDARQTQIIMSWAIEFWNVFIYSIITHSCKTRCAGALQMHMLLDTFMEAILIFLVCADNLHRLTLQYEIAAYLQTRGDNMARITVEDCQERVDNRFLLVQMAIKRVRQYRDGYEPLIETRNKEVVTALREIAAGKIMPDDKELYTPVPAPAPAED